MVNHRRVRSRRLFLCTFIDRLAMMMILFCLFFYFLAYIYERVFISFGTSFYSWFGACFFYLRWVSLLAVVALLSAGFYLSFHAVAVVALI